MIYHIIRMILIRTTLTATPILCSMNNSETKIAMVTSENKLLTYDLNTRTSNQILLNMVVTSSLDFYISHIHIMIT